MLVNSKGTHLTIQKKSKWTWEAVDSKGKSVATDKSKKKLIEKLSATPCSKDSKFNIEGTQIGRFKTKKLVAKCQTKKITKVAKPKKTKKTKPLSMRKMTIDLIKLGQDDGEILKEVKRHYPDAQYNISHVQWYRSNFAKTGLITGEFAPKRSQLYKQWLVEQKTNN